MAKLTGQTIDLYVSVLDAVYESGGVWYTADIDNPPQGIYEGNNTVITPRTRTSVYTLTVDTIFLGEEYGEFNGDIIITSNAENSPTPIPTYATCVELSLKNILGSKLDADYEEYVNEDLSDNQYIDFDMTMQKNPNTGDIPRKLDADSVMQSIKNILLNKRLWYGDELNIYNLVFQNPDEPFKNRTIEETIKDKIESSERRIGVLEVGVVYDKYNNPKDITINISFSLKNNPRIMYNYPIFVRIR